MRIRHLILISIFSISGVLAQSSLCLGQDAQRIQKPLGKANKLLRRMHTADAAARDTITEADILNSPVKLKVNVRKVDKLQSGALVIIGDVIVRRGSDDRYKTESERREIAAANKDLRWTKSERVRLMKAFKVEYRTSFKKNGQIYVDGKFSRHFNAGESPRGTVKSMQSALRRGLQEEIAEAQNALSDLNREINRFVEKRRQKAEKVEVEIDIDLPLLDTIDVPKLVDAKKPELIGMVDNYGFGQDPDEIGGHHYIKHVFIKATDIDEKYKK